MSCIYSADHASYVDCILSCMCRGEHRVLILVSGLLRLDRVPQACRKVRTRSTTSVHLLHEVILLLSGFSGKMTISPDTITIIAMLVLSLLSIMSRCLPHVKYQPLNNAMKTFNLFNLANHGLAMLLLA